MTFAAARAPRCVLLTVLLAVAPLPVGPGPARACSIHGAGAGSELNDWVLGDVDSDGLLEAFIGIEDELVPPTDATVCVCGIGLGTSENRLPAGASVTGARIAVLNVTSRTMSDFPAFGFSANPTTSTGLAAGSGPGGPPGTQPLFDGATWFGFSALVDPFVLPSLGPDELIVLGFDLDLEAAVLPLIIEAQFAAGEGDTSGSPLFFSAHPPQYFSATDPVATLVPEPGAHVLRAFAVAAVAVLTWRGVRRSVSAQRTCRTGEHLVG